MITGFDKPKQGVFAYIHMMMRLTIITLSVSLCMLREWREIIRNKHILKHYKSLLSSVQVQYVSVVFVYCISNIALSPVYYIPSGANFYKTLLGIYLALGLINILSIVIKGDKQRRGQNE